jgi:hypothetical protein
VQMFYLSKSIVLMSYYTTEPILMQFQPFYTLKKRVKFVSDLSHVCNLFAKTRIHQFVSAPRVKAWIFSHTCRYCWMGTLASIA